MSLLTEVFRRNASPKPAKSQPAISLKFSITKKNISLEVALKIEATLGIRAGLLLDVQQEYELQKAREEMSESLGSLQKLTA